MIDLPWKVFEKTGNIETYLLMKQMEETYQKKFLKDDQGQVNSSLSNSRT